LRQVRGCAAARRGIHACCPLPRSFVFSASTIFCAVWFAAGGQAGAGAKQLSSLLCSGLLGNPNSNHGGTLAQRRVICKTSRPCVGYSCTVMN
jgi:hypothetical protein